MHHRPVSPEAVGAISLERTDMGKVYRISCRDAGVDCDFQAEGSSLDEIMQLCADHGIREHNMKGFGTELYLKMRSCVQILEVGNSGSKEEAPRGE
jgi:predicted small metal-binding protein